MQVCISLFAELSSLADVQIWYILTYTAECLFVIDPTFFANRSVPQSFLLILEQTILCMYNFGEFATGICSCQFAHFPPRIFNSKSKSRFKVEQMILLFWSGRINSSFIGTLTIDIILVLKTNILKDCSHSLTCISFYLCDIFCLPKIQCRRCGEIYKYMLAYNTIFIPTIIHAGKFLT